MSFPGAIITILVAVILTALTQIGGVIYLLSRYFYKYIDKIVTKTFGRIFAKTAAFTGLYLITTFFIIPYLAQLSGRVRLPLSEQHHIRPLTFITVLLNRNYVKPELRNAAFLLGDEMNAKSPGTTINYLDGCFPFINKFPLLPHLSHNDGNKLDLAFCYKDAAGNESNNHPSFTGYGICERLYRMKKTPLNSVSRMAIFNTAF